MHLASHKTTSKVFISSLFLLVCVSVVVSNPVKPSMKSSTIKVNFALLKLVNTVQWYSRTNRFLLIEKDGTVKGTSNCTLPTVTMEMYSVGLAGVKMIKGVASGRYLAMNKYGNVYTTATASEETLLFERINSHNYSTFASFKYYRQALYDAFIAMKKNGIVQTMTNSQQTSVEFVPMPTTVLC